MTNMDSCYAEIEDDCFIESKTNLSYNQSHTDSLINETGISRVFKKVKSGALCENQEIEEQVVENPESTNQNGSSLQRNQRRTIGSASLIDTICNLMKVCMGTGMFALPYAFINGKILVSFFGVILIAAWNYHSIRTLLNCVSILAEWECLEEIEDKRQHVQECQFPVISTEMEEGTASQSNRLVQETKVIKSPSQRESRNKKVETPKISSLEAHAIYAAIGYSAFGKFGERLVEIGIMITLFGCCVSYLITSAQLLTYSNGEFIQFSNDSNNDNSRGISETTIYTFFSCLLLLPICFMPSVASLSRSSIVGIILTFVAFIVIIAYGSYHHHDFRDEEIALDPIHLDGNSSNISEYLPTLAGFSRFFGITSFCFGIPAVIFPIKHSMRDETKFQSACKKSLSLVSILYITLSITIICLFGTQIQNTPQIMQVLPNTKWYTELLNILVSLVCLTTFPLALFPLSEWFHDAFKSSKCQGKPLFKQSSSEGQKQNQNLPTPNNRIETSYDHNINLQYCKFKENSPMKSTTHITNYVEASEKTSLLFPGTSNQEKTNSHDDKMNINEEIDLLESRSSYSYLNTPTVTNLNEDDILRQNYREKLFIRILLLVLTTACAVLIPCFGLIVTLLGSFSIGTISYVLPPLFHLRLMTIRREKEIELGTISMTKYSTKHPWSPPDLLMFVLGCLLCAFTTVLAVIGNTSCS